MNDSSPLEKAEYFPHFRFVGVAVLIDGGEERVLSCRRDVVYVVDETMSKRFLEDESDVSEVHVKHFYCIFVRFMVHYE